MPTAEALTRVAHATQVLMEAVSDAERERAIKKLEAQMAATFRAQGRAVLRAFTQFKRHFVESSLDTSIESILETALKVTVPQMVKDFTGAAVAGYEWGYGDLARSMELQDAFSLAHPEAVQWAEARSAARVAGVNATTKKSIRDLIVHGLENGESYGSVQRSIKRQFEEFAVRSPLAHIQSRAELVAVTEMGEAYEAGAARLSGELTDAGIDQEKKRAGPNDGHTSEACKSDLAAGWIPKAQAFPSGIMSGLEHPGCRHTTLYRVARGPVETPVPAPETAPQAVPEPAVVPGPVRARVGMAAPTTAGLEGQAAVLCQVYELGSLPPKVQASILAGIRDVIGPSHVRLGRLGFQKAGQKSYGRARQFGDVLEIEIQKSFALKAAKKQAEGRANFAAWREERIGYYKKAIADPARARLKSSNEMELEAFRATTRWAIMESAEDPIRAAMQHEAWHIMDYATGRSLRNRFDSAISAAGAWDLVAQVSQYGRSSMGELFAETGAAISSGVEIPAKLARIFKKVVKDAGLTVPGV